MIVLFVQLKPVSSQAPSLNLDQKRTMFVVYNLGLKIFVFFVLMLSTICEEVKLAPAVVLFETKYSK